MYSELPPPSTQPRRDAYDAAEPVQKAGISVEIATECLASMALEKTLRCAGPCLCRNM